MKRLRRDSPYLDNRGERGRGPQRSRLSFVSSGEGAEEGVGGHVVLEGFATVDEDDGDFVVVDALQVGIGVDVDLAPLEIRLIPELAQGVFDDVAEMTSGAGINHNIVHAAIVNRRHRPCDVHCRVAGKIARSGIDSSA